MEEFFYPRAGVMLVDLSPAGATPHLPCSPPQTRKSTLDPCSKTSLNGSG